ncbi:EAL domain-containing protein [Marinobacter sp. 71-i]|uniref:EAL domain-containing protein n=1 Tax=Marinobacter iranensis TaxID=2962607 RepID=A0ABT5Y526_9GAMM|nr:EAL domain-containing protein [Marinobacter iranensis]MDF0748676.1 EAL domain-containing protein [Marinobacter iranensis]
MRGTGQKTNLQRKLTALIAGLCLTIILTVGFMVAVVQLQSAITAYTWGESVWSRAQVDTVHHLDRFAQTGRFPELAMARQSLSIPIGDLHARIAMTSPELHWQRAQNGLIQGGNHPRDVNRMILLVRYFSWLDQLDSALTAWENTDGLLLELDQIGNALEREWLTGTPDRERLQALRERLSLLDQRLQQNARKFRLAMGDAARWAASFLSIVSASFLIFVALLSWFLGFRLVRLLQRAEQNFRSIFEQSAIGIIQIDTSGRIVNANQATCDILGYQPNELVPYPYRELVHPEDWDIASEERRAINRGDIDSYTTEHRLVRKDNEFLWARLTVSRVWDAPSASAYFTTVLEDISESHRLSTELSFMATHDSLTGLINRRAFEHQLASRLGRVRKEGSQHALCFIDLDQFKVANDTSGHDAGDHLLRQVADIIGNNLREADTLARLGGDEFGIILENCNLNTARHVAEKVRAALDHLVFTWQETSHTISCSIGVVPITAESSGINALMKAADIACYTAKDSGRNRVCVMSMDDEHMASQRGQMEWLNRIQAALQGNLFFLECQIIAPPSKPRGGLRYEVLIRLRSPDGSVVPPSAFLPPAERYGVAAKIDRWVINHVLSKLSEAPQHLAALEACHINLSGRSFDKADFADFVVEQFDHYGVPPGKICFEITETAAVHNLLEVQAFMKRLSDMGCSFALDDFGSGLSSFGYLRRLPVTCLKIDGMFVRDIVTNKTDLAMVRAIHDIGRTMNMTTVAEYVESKEAASLLTEIGVNLIQGFWVHRPCPLDDILAREPAQIYSLLGPNKT